MKAGNFVNIKCQEMIPQEINTESGLLSKLSDKEIWNYFDKLKNHDVRWGILQMQARCKYSRPF